MHGAKVGEFREVPGPESKKFLDRAGKSLAKTTVSSDVIIDGGERIRLFDVDGNEYLAFDAGVSVANLGYGSSQNNVWKAIEETYKKGAPLYIGTDRFNPEAIEAAELLKKITPIRNRDSRVFLASAGTLATETAMKAVLKEKFRREKGEISPESVIFLHCTGSFHGRSHGALVLMDKRKKERWEGYNLPYESVNLPFPAAKKLEAINEFISQIENIPEQMIKYIGGFFIEIVQGEGGMYPIDKDALKFLDAWCVKYNVPLIVDEIQTGFCRTGSFWAYEQYGITPDIVLFGKAGGGGILPVCGTIIREDLSFKALGEHSATFGFDPIFATAVQETILEMLDLDLDTHSLQMGNYFMHQLEKEFGLKPWIKEIRGLGLMIGIEFCHPETKKPFSQLRDIFWRECEKYGLLTLPAGINSANPSMRFEPPLILGEIDVDIAMEILRIAAKYCDEFLDQEL